MEREHFLLHAPFQWVAVPGNNPMEFEFRNKTLSEQIIVTVLLAQSPFDQERQHAMAAQLADIRLKAIAQLSNGKAEHAPIQFQSGSNQVEARCFGRDVPNKVQFAFVVRVAAAKVVTVALTRYFLEDVGTPFSAYAGVIFDLLQIQNPNGPASQE